MESLHPRQAEVALVALLLLSSAVACSSAPRDEDWGDERDTPPPVADAVGWVDGVPITYGEVGHYLRRREADTFYRLLEGLTLERITRNEAQVLGVTIQEALLKRATRRGMVKWEASVRAASKAQTGEEVEPAVWLERATGLTMTEFRGQVRHDTEVELLVNRLLRYEQVVKPSVEVSILVVGSRDLAESLLERLRSGEGFPTLAKENSVHASAAAEGRIEFQLLQADFNDGGVSRAIFDAKAGEVCGPFPTRTGEETWYQLYRIDAVHPARRVPWERVRGEVEENLRKCPVSDGEYERWRRRILLRHGFVAAPTSGDTG